MTTTDTQPPSALERRELTRDEFGAEARRRFGDNPLDWAFICPWCGDIATAREFPEGYRPYVGQICIGRLPVQFPYAPIVADPARGCHTWTTNFQIDGPWIVTLPDGTAARCFALAPAPSQPPHAPAQDPDGIGGPGSADVAPDAAVGAGIGNDAPTVEAPGAYWSVEHGWSDEPRVGCACHISAPCYSCESLVICTECPGDVAVLEYEMDAHKAEVHPQRAPLPSEPFLTGDDDAEAES